MLLINLIQDGKSDDEIKTILEEVLPTIVENQKKTDLTATCSFRCPSVWAASFTEKDSDKNAEQTDKNDNPWLMWLDTSLLFIGIVALLNTVIDFFNSTTTSSGLLSLLAPGFGGGAAMYATYHFIYRHSGKPKSERPGWTKNHLGAWFGNAWLGSSFTLEQHSCQQLSTPQLPAIVMLIIGAAALLGRHFLQKKYNILNAMTPKQ